MLRRFTVVIGILSSGTAFSLSCRMTGVQNPLQWGQG